MRHLIAAAPLAGDSWWDYVGGFVIAVAAVATALGVLGRFGPVRWLARKVFGPAWKAVVRDPAHAAIAAIAAEVSAPIRVEVGEMRSDVSALRDEVAAVAKEVTPNGGDTMRLGDRVARIELSLAERRRDRELFGYELRPHDDDRRPEDG